MTEINVKKEDLELNTKVHLLPCKIMHNGQAKVESYFDSCIYKMENNENGNILYFEIICFIMLLNYIAYETALRGRPLNGVISKLHNDRIGLIIESTSTSTSTWKTIGSFNQLYSWQFDEPKVTLSNDPFTTTLKDWLKISEIVSIAFLTTNIFVF